MQQIIKSGVIAFYQLSSLLQSCKVRTSGFLYVKHFDFDDSCTRAMSLTVPERS